MSYTMEQVTRFPFRVVGAAGDELVDGYQLAFDVWGAEAVEARGSTHGAFAYLWRRFGPPFQGSDRGKDLVRYVLTTPDPEVFLVLHLGGSQLCYAVAYLARDTIREELNRPFREWETRHREWFAREHAEVIAQGQKQAMDAYLKLRRDDAHMDAMEKVLGPYPGRCRAGSEQERGPLAARVNEALITAMRELLRPVFVRDVPLNILGRVPDDQCDFEHAVEPSRYAGLGVPREAMDVLLAEDKQ